MCESSIAHAATIELRMVLDCLGDHQRDFVHSCGREDAVAIDPLSIPSNFVGRMDVGKLCDINSLAAFLAPSRRLWSCFLPFDPAVCIPSDVKSA